MGRQSPQPWSLRVLALQHRELVVGGLQRLQRRQVHRVAHRVGGGVAQLEVLQRGGGVADRDGLEAAGRGRPLSPSPPAPKGVVLRPRNNLLIKTALIIGEARGIRVIVNWC